MTIGGDELKDLLHGDQAFWLSQALDTGLTQRQIAHAVMDGILLKLGAEIYLPESSLRDPNLAELELRAPDATLCFLSALDYWGLTDYTPPYLDLAVPRDSCRPSVSFSAHWHTFDKNTFTVGRELVEIKGTSVHIYSPERAIIDALKYRDLVGFEVGEDALKIWLTEHEGNPSSLLTLSTELPKTQQIIRQALAEI